MEAALEVLPVGGRSLRNRKWPSEVNARVVAETLEPGSPVNEAASRHGVPKNHVSSWRTLARKGWRILPAPKDPEEFATLMLRSGEEPPPFFVRPMAERVEIVVGGRHVAHPAPQLRERRGRGIWRRRLPKARREGPQKAKSPLVSQGGFFVSGSLR